MPVSQNFNYVVIDNYVAIGDYSAIHSNGYLDKNVQNLVVPSSIEGKIVKKIKYRALSCLYELTSIVLPSSIEKIEGDLVTNCFKLKSIYFQEPSRIETLSYYTFYGCQNLEQVILPSSVLSVGVNAFTGCSSLKWVVSPSPNCIFDENFNIDGNSNVIIYVPKCFKGSISNAAVIKSLECLFPLTNKMQCRLIKSVLALFFIV